MSKTYNERYKRWYDNHKEEIRKKKATIARNLYAKSPQKYRQRSSRYYQQHRNKILDKQKKKDRTVTNSYARKYRRLHPFRTMANMSNSRCQEKITAFDLWKIAKRQKMICPLTGDRLTRDNISVDHVVPRTRGGKNISANIRLTTLQVNMARKDLPDERFVELCQKVVFSRKNLL